MTCDYASCPRPAVTVIDSWLFCRDHAITHADETVGSTVVARPATRSGPIDRTPAAHGTVRAYHQHRRAREKPCDACRTANTTAERERRQDRRAA